MGQGATLTEYFQACLAGDVHNNCPKEEYAQPGLPTFAFSFARDSVGDEEGDRGEDRWLFLYFFR